MKGRTNACKETYSSTTARRTGGPSGLRRSRGRARSSGIRRYKGKQIKGEIYVKEKRDLVHCVAEAGAQRCSSIRRYEETCECMRRDLLI